MTRLIWLLTGILLSSKIAVAEDLRVTLLGTGSPRPDIERFGPSTLVEYKNQKYLFDVGRGTTIRLAQIGIAPSQIDHLFLTHLHSDHISGFADFWLTGWIWQRKKPLNVFGPEGIEGFVKHINAAFSKDISFRRKQTNLSTKGLILDTEIIRAGIVYENDDVTITAIPVEHGAVEDAYAFRFDTAQHAILISGDTTYSERLVEYGKNLDLLVHELAVIKPILVENNFKLKRIADYHSSLDDVEKVVEQIRPKQTILNHLLIIGVQEEELNKEIQSRFGASVSLGHDLMTIKLSSSQR
jgi:ribonuclease Z